MSTSDHLTIHIQSKNDQGDDDQQLSTSVDAEAPLSPASVKSYMKNRVRATLDADCDANSSEDDDEDEDDEEDETYNTSHLDPRLEALDGTTKYQEKTKSEHEAKARSGDDEGDDEVDGDEGDESPPEPLDRDDQIAKDMDDLTVEDKNKKLPNLTIMEGEDSSLLRVPGGRPASMVDSSTGSDSTVQASGEDAQEPAKPHITLPCLIETATNPPRTRITLRYAGQPPSTPTGNNITNKSTSATADAPAATTRGSRVHMVATDLSGESWYATEWAITTILRSGDELNVVTIVEDDKDAKGVHKGLRTEMREDAEKLTKNIHDQLEHTRLRDITVIIHIIAATKSHGAKELLIEMIDDIEDLSTVIVGSRGRGAIKGLLLGSISNFLVHNSPVPVMVVRAPKNKGKKKKKGKKGRQVEHTRVVREANKRYEAAMSSDDDL